MQEGKWDGQQWPVPSRRVRMLQLMRSRFWKPLNTLKVQSMCQVDQRICKVHVSRVSYIRTGNWKICVIRVIIFDSSMPTFWRLPTIFSMTKSNKNGETGHLPNIAGRLEWYIFGLCKSLSKDHVLSEPWQRMKHKGERVKQCVWFTKCDNSHIFHLYVIIYPLGSMVALGARYYPVPHTEVKDALKGPYFEPLTKLSNPQGNRAIWRSGDSSRTGNWLLSSCVLRLGLTIPVQPFAADIDKHTAVCLLRYPSLAWNQGLVI